MTPLSTANHGRAMKNTAAVLALLAASALGACEKNPAAAAAPSGSLQVSYTGYRTGAIAAEGRPGRGIATTYAAAYDVVDAENAAGHVGAEEYRNGVAQSIVMTLNALTTGTYDLAPGCAWATARCGYGLFQYDLDATDNIDPESYEIRGGSITIADASGGRLRGTFSITAQQFNPATGNLIAGRVLTFTGGQYDVPVVDLTRG